MTVHHKEFSDGRAKEEEGKRQAALGELTGDSGQKLKGEAKQALGAVIQAGEAAQEGIQSLADKVKDRLAPSGPSRP